MIAIKGVKGNTHIIRTRLETRDILTKDLRQGWLLSQVTSRYVEKG
jgi:hypothetical protein